MTEIRILEVIPKLNEKDIRNYLALEAMSLGRGGISEISELTGVSRTTISFGRDEILSGKAENTSRIRKEGGRRKKLVDTQENLEEELEKMINPYTIGNPENPLKWTTKSIKNLTEALIEKKFKISQTSVGRLLKNMGYGLQINKKCLQVGESHPDRNAQFEHINEQAKIFISENEPVISVDTKKKELIGNFQNKGQEYSPKGQPVEVLDHDFALPELGKVNPYGVYDLHKNKGFINLGNSCDTADFAVESIYRWWEQVGSQLYTNATKLYITCDGGGSNSSRARLWKVRLSELANKIGLDIYVSHFPPGTSKWNKVEHNLFSYISKNWRGRPLGTVQK